ncbi:MAG: Stp1/IreP family PP2C-type Ser/Thr phosphatase [Planctomycetaceae bacterium]|nr:Stp1/IreP family PP2C-type Ser/Thr phosphatase [Planctomycetaceae bacterium]
MKVGTQIYIAGKSDVGLQRANNEDALAILDGGNVCVVADGMGGHLGGEVASSMVTDAIRVEFLNSAGTITDPKEIARRLVSVIEEANAEIHARGNRDAKLRNMGTTVVAAVFQGSSIIYASVGDSRIYRLRNGKLEQLTEDHSWVGELRKRNLISNEDARNHPLRNIITRALGMEKDVDVDCTIAQTQPGDLYLFCSDGLTDLVNEQEMQETLAGCGGDIDAAIDNLIEAANDYGGIDNITVGIARVDAA